MPSILAIDSNMNNRTDMMAITPLGSNSVHHLRITDADDAPFHIRLDTMTGHLLDIRYLATICSLIRECIAQGSTYRMRREMFDMGRKMKQLLLVNMVRMDGSHRKLSMRQRASLVEDNGMNLRQNIHIVSAFDEDAIT